MASQVSLTPLIHQTLDKVPAIAISSERWALLCSTMEKVCIAAAFGLGAAALTIGMLGMTISTGAYLLSTACLIVCVLSSAKLQTLATDSRFQAEFARGVHAHLKAIAHWGENEVKEFFQRHCLSIEQLPLTELHSLNQREPLTALLPLIGRFNYCAERVANSYRSAMESIKAASRIEEPDLRQLQYHLGYQKLFTNAIPESFETAAMLRLIQYPDREPELSPWKRSCPEKTSEWAFNPLSTCFITEEKTLFSVKELIDLIARQDYAMLSQRLFG